MKEILKKAERLGCKIPHKKWSDIDREVGPVLRAMEKNGIKLDIKILRSLEKKLTAKSLKLETRICKLAGREFNISSPGQLSEILFSKLKLPTGDLRRIKSGISTSASELAKLEDKHKIIPAILEYRELKKLLSTYLEPLPTLVDDDSRLHTHFGQDTRTTRLTSSEPNLQNIPIKGEWGPEIRQAFIAERGYKLISADYSQIELRVVACLAGDKVMLKAFRDGIDIHAKTASELFRLPLSKVGHDHRRLAKTVNFGIVYGISPFGLSQTLGIARESAAEYIFRYFDIHKGIKKYCEEQINFAQKHGYVETLFGFRRKLPEINSDNRGAAEGAQRMAINTPVQGTAAEILILAMIELHKKLSATSLKLSAKSAKMILTVHDELVIEAPAEKARELAKLVKKVMEGEVKLCVPVEVGVGIGDNWDAAKKDVVKFIE